MLEEEDLILRFCEKQNLELYLKGVTDKPGVASPGRSDPFLTQLMGQLRFGDEALDMMGLLDVGCGEARLPVALSARTEWPLWKMHYVGFDLDIQRVEKARLNAEKFGVHTTLGSVEFYDRLEDLNDYIRSHTRDSQRPFRFLWVFLVNVLHEMALEELPLLFEHLTLWVAHQGCLLIQELGVLPKAEGCYIPWDSESLRIMFSLPGLEFSSELRRSRRGLPVMHVCVKKLLSDHDLIDYNTWHSHILHDVVPLMKFKIERGLRLSRRQHNDAAFMNYVLAKKNIMEYLEYERIAGRHHEPYPDERSGSLKRRIPDFLVIGP